MLFFMKEIILFPAMTIYQFFFELELDAQLANKNYLQLL